MRTQPFTATGHGAPSQTSDFFITCIKCFGKKDKMKEIKTYYKKVLWVCAYLSSLKTTPLLYGAPSYKSGVQKVNLRGAY